MKSSSSCRQCQATIHRTGAARTVAAALALGVMCGGLAWGQQNVFSRSDAGTNLWENSTNKPWFYQTWNSAENRPDYWPYPTRNDVFFGHNNNLVQDVNTTAWFALRSLTMQGSASSARTFNSSGGAGIGLSSAFTNESGSGAHTFNTQVGIDASAVTFTNSGGTVSFTNSVFLNVNTLQISGANDFLFSGALSGTGGALTKTGSGTLTLSGSNSYTGATAVNQGTLLINGSQASATGNVSVASGAKLGGTGTIGGDTSITGTYAPGAVASVGTQNFNGKNLTFNSGSIFEWDVTSASSFDKVTGINSLLGSGGIFNIVSDIGAPFWENSQTFSDVFNTGTLSSVFSSFQLNGSSLTNGIVADKGTFSFSGNDVSWVPIPEPSTALAGILLAAGLLRRRR